MALNASNSNNLEQLSFKGLSNNVEMDVFDVLSVHSSHDD